MVVGKESRLDLACSKAEWHKMFKGNCMRVDIIGETFFFHAEDGIRDGHETGVQTCALPIWAALARAADNVEAMVTAMHGYLADSLEVPAEIDRVGLNTTRLLLALGDLVVGWLLVRQSEIATSALDAGAASDAGAGDADTAFYQGKIAAARFFAETVLPRLAAEREIVETTTTDLMDLAEAAF